MPRPPKQPQPAPWKGAGVKRPASVVIDLTGDDDHVASARPAKSPRYPSSSYASQPQLSQSSQSSSSYQPRSPFQPPALVSGRPSFLTPNSTPPALPASQRSLGDDDLEPSTQDLTQSDDGPQLELYGSFGMTFLILTVHAA